MPVPIQVFLFMLGIVLVAFGLVFGISALATGSWRQFPRRWRMRNEAAWRSHICALARLSVDLLREDPEGWERDVYHLKHEATGVNFWIGNGEEHLRPDSLSAGSKHKPWGYSGRPTLDQAYLWKAYEAWLVRESVNNPGQIGAILKHLNEVRARGNHDQATG